MRTYPSFLAAHSVREASATRRVPCILLIQLADLAESRLNVFAEVSIELPVCFEVAPSIFRMEKDSRRVDGSFIE